MLKAYKYRIYPNSSQRVLLAKTFGSVRYFWNRLTETFNSYDKETNPDPTYVSSTDIRKDLIWMQEISAAALQQKQRDFIELKNQYFSKNRKKKIGKPSFKSKSNKQSYRLPNRKFDIKDCKIRLEKIGWIRMVVDRCLPEDVKLLSVTVSKTATGKYFASVLVEQEIRHKPKSGYTAGIDVGLKEFATLSDGTVISNPKYYRDSQAIIGRLQRRQSRKRKGSVRYRKLKLRIAREHEKIRNRRIHFLHTISSQIVRDYDIISVEDLNVEGMKQNNRLSLSISDASFSSFISMLECKSKWYGKKFVMIDRWFPSSRTCSVCGWYNPDLTLKDRIFKCGKCGIELDRDYNAAININAVGVAADTDAEAEDTRLVKRLGLDVLK